MLIKHLSSEPPLQLGEMHQLILSSALEQTSTVFNLNFCCTFKPFGCVCSIYSTSKRRGKGRNGESGLTLAERPGARRCTETSKTMRFLGTATVLWETKAKQVGMLSSINYEANAESTDRKKDHTRVHQNKHL